MRVPLLLAAAVAVGVVSRVDELDGDWSGVSTHPTWLLFAAVAGAARPGGWRPAALGAAVLTLANAAYYVWIAATEPGTPLASVAGSPTWWFALGLSGGAFFGALGGAFATGPAARRALAVAAAAAVITADALNALDLMLP